MSTRETTRETTRESAPRADQDRDSKTPTGQEPGTNAVEHEPDPTAKPIPDGEHKYVPRSPFTHGND